jgi:hypothetical protein
MKNSILFFMITLAVAGIATFMKIPLASSQGLTLSSTLVADDLPFTDPSADLWRSTTAVTVPLSAQNISKPISLETHTREVIARALQNESHIAVMLEWDDKTQNDSVVRVQDFSDMAALQFPLIEGQPFFCMGQEGGDVNIWTWKAVWQSDLLAWQDVEDVYEAMYVEQFPFTEAIEDQYPGPEDYIETAFLPALEVGNLLAIPGRGTSVENLIAGGFGSLTALPASQQMIQGHGEWIDGKWRVIFSRQLDIDAPEEVNFEPGRVYSMAIAIWDGEFKERDGLKSTSQWVSLQLASDVTVRPPAVVEPGTLPWWRSAETVGFILVGGVVLLLIIGAIIYFRLPE